MREKAALCQSAGSRLSPSTEMSWMANLRMMVQIIPRGHLRVAVHNLCTQERQRERVVKSQGWRPRTCLSPTPSSDRLPRPVPHLR